MGGNNNRQSSKKSPFGGAFNFIKRRPRRVEHDNSYYDDTRRVFPSDEDGRGPWRVADPRIDTKTSDFIAHFYATRVSESDRICQPATKA